MKTLLSIIAFIFIVNIGTSQVLIGYPKQSIEHELDSLNIKFDSGYDIIQCSNYTTFYTNKAQIKHYYDDSDMCVVVYITPNSKKDTKYLTNMFNKKFKKHNKICWTINNVNILMSKINNKTTFIYL